MTALSHYAKFGKIQIQRCDSEEKLRATKVEHLD